MINDLPSCVYAGGTTVGNGSGNLRMSSSFRQIQQQYMQQGNGKHNPKFHIILIINDF